MLRDINVSDLDLNITCFQGSSVKLGNIFLYDQALRYTEGFFVGDNRETSAIAPAPLRNDYRIQRSKCVYECRYTFPWCIPSGLLHHPVWMFACEDQCCTDCSNYNVDNGSNIFAQRNYTVVMAGLVTCSSHTGQ